MAIGGVQGQKNKLILYERTFYCEFNAFYGIKKSCFVVEIFNFEILKTQGFDHSHFLTKIGQKWPKSGQLRQKSKIQNYGPLPNSSMSNWSKFGVFIIIFGEEDTFLVKFQKKQLKFQFPWSNPQVTTSSYNLRESSKNCKTFTFASITQLPPKHGIITFFLIIYGSFRPNFQKNSKVVKYSNN